MKKNLFKKSNILIILLLLTLSLTVLILFKLRITSINSTESKNQVVKKNPINQEVYKEDIYSILRDYEKIIKEANIYATSTKRNLSSDNSIIKQIDTLKEKVMATKAPSFEYKDLHVNLLMSLLSMKNYIKAPEEKNMKICNDYISKVKISSSVLLE